MGLDVATEDFGSGLRETKAGVRMGQEDRKHLPPDLPGCRYLLSELDDERQLVGLDKIQEVLFGHLAIERVATFIKLEHTKHLDRDVKTTQQQQQQQQARVTCR